MSRQHSERRRAQVVVRQEAELRAELERLTAITAECTWGEDCPCHYTEWRDLQSVRFLLGEDEV